MKSRLKVYDVRKRVDKPENGRKPCYLLLCLYRRKSYLPLGEVDLMLWAKLWLQVRVVSPWVLERIWLCFYPNISHCWVDFLGWFFFKKINKIRHKDLEEKSARTWNRIPTTSPLSQQLRASGTGLSGGQQSQPVAQVDQDSGVGAASVGLLPRDPPSLLLPPKLLPRGQTWSQSRPCQMDGCGGTTRSPFCSSKAVMCSRQKPNLGCFGPKETFTTKLYTLENKWAFILEGNPTRLFIICTTIIKLVLISIVECCWVGQLAGPSGLSGHHFILKKVRWEAGTQPPPPPGTFFSRSIICFVLCVFIATSKQTPLFFLFSFILIFKNSWSLPEKKKKDLM